MPGIFDQWKIRLTKTREVTFGKIVSLFGGSEITDDTWDELESLLIQADMGLKVSTEVIQSLKKDITDLGITKSEEYHKLLRNVLLKRLPSAQEIVFQQKPAVVLVVGVNGSGKTTSIGKLGAQYQNQGKTVMFAAADTFRAAAVDQLKVWGDRLRIPVISGQDEGDPGAVAFDAVQAALSKKTDILFIDTAGRLHTRFNLMEELKKVHRVVTKAFPGAPEAVWIVLDATTGQNAFTQAKLFKEAVKVDGVILSKLDSSAKGGMVFAIYRELGLPILYAGLGEKIEDLEVFDPEKFVDGLLA